MDFDMGIVDKPIRTAAGKLKLKVWERETVEVGWKKVEVEPRISRI